VDINWLDDAEMTAVER